MAVRTKTYAAYERLALEDPDGRWELHNGRLRQKPDMTTWHNFLARRLGVRLRRQLDEDQFDVVVDQGRVRWSRDHAYIPDVIVVPMQAVREGITRHPQRLEAYVQPLPLVVEVWSPSTGDYDVRVKLENYRRRGDAEIWYLHPLERTLTAWRRQPDGSYTETTYRGGTITPVALPGVSIDLDALFALI